MDAWRSMGVTELGRGIEAGTVDPLALAECYLDAAAEHAEGGRIYARLTRHRALAEAAAAHDRARAGLRRGLLDGVPLSWKDLFDSAGTATEAGSALLKDRVPASDATALARATAAGMVCLGKTHMSELAFSGLGLNPITATPPCINDPAAVPGGSSSGAATSVAFGLAPAAIGSDTGGSVRVPAAWNDLVGLKTSHGRIPTDGAVPLCEMFDTVGPIARNVEDAAALFAMLDQSKPADLEGASLQGTRLAVLRTIAFDGIRDTPAEGFEAARRRLEAAGATVTDLDAPCLPGAMDLSVILYTTEAYAIWRETIEAAPHLMFPPILERFRGGASQNGADYVAAWRSLRAARAAWRALVASFDAVILPTTPNMPPDAARLMTDTDYYVTENLLTLRNTRIGNLMDVSALSLPTGTPSVGISLMAGPGEEARLLRLGAAAERALAAG